MSLLIFTENMSLWETCIHRTSAVKMVGFPFGSLSLFHEIIAPTKDYVKYSCIYLATSAREICALSVLIHMNNLLIFFSFFSDRKELFCFNWVTSAEISHHRGKQFEIPLVSWWFDKVTKKKNATIWETSHYGHRGSSGLWLFQAYLDSTFWWQI